MFERGLTRPAALALLLCSWSWACGDPGSSVNPRAQDQAASATSEDEGPGLPAWGPRVPATVPADALASALAAELTRDPLDPRLQTLVAATESGPGRTRALWSLARIGGPVARDRLLAELDREAPSALAAIALLEVPVFEPGSPPEPMPGDPWGQLEDALWTRLAVSEPGRSVSAVGESRALLLAIARVGGTRSIERLGVELADQPGPEHPPAVVARWSAAMQALGILCARGLILDAGTIATIHDGLERDDPQAAHAALYALSRCARSSGEELLELRDPLLRRLAPYVQDPAAREQPEHAALAWRAAAALGALPDPLPAGILGAKPPDWTVEVEAVRALGTTAAGRSELRSRLSALPAEAFAGPRQHVVLAALQSMRPGIAGDPRAADAELAGVGQMLAAGRRSDDPRLRRGSAMGLCELRLLQAIRAGDPDSVRGCDRSPDAPAIEPLPTSWLAELEVEALLQATQITGAEGRTQDNLGTAPIDEETALLGDETGEAGATAGATSGASAGATGPDDPVRRARVFSLLAMARDTDPARATPALAALAEVDDATVLPVLRAALVREDPGILAAATTAIAVRSIDASKRDLEVVPLLEDIVRDRREAAALEARLAAIEALGALARSAVPTVNPDGADTQANVGESPWLARTVAPLATDPAVAVRRKAREALLGHGDLLLRFDEQADRAGAIGGEGMVQRTNFGERLAADLQALLAKPALGLRVQTSAGSFTITFAGVSAPYNQANLVALATAGFYEGLRFHRVVPGFVVQGGDPRGDGYGGPGYLLPCEWSNLHYERGTVGIALAGKDTGGSQFFITQTPQPHLDARYTVIGQVSEGMDVVDRLLPGDRIEAVEVLAVEPSDGDGDGDGGSPR